MQWVRCRKRQNVSFRPTMFAMLRRVADRMNNAFRCILIITLLLSGVYTGKAQSPRVARGGEDDRFNIGRGTLFSATTSKNQTAEKLKTPYSETILNDIDEAIDIITRNYYSSSDARPDILAKSGINSMLRSLDPHSSYYDPPEFEDLIGEQKSEYFGTGVTISDFERDGILESYVISTFPASAADRAGLRFGDRIIAVNGSLVAGLTSREIRGLIRGPLGTTVRLTIERSGKLINFDLRRAKIASPTVTNAFLLGNGVGIIELSDGFSLTTPAEFDAALIKLKSEGMRSLILDLRGNPGGILESAIRVAERFLPAGRTIVSQRGRGIYDNRVWKSENRRPETIPLIILVNRETASASEVLAGALQDNDRALIVGEKTFGKGLVQTVIDLPGGGGLTLTTARYFTPSGRLIQRDYEKTGNYDYYRHSDSPDPSTQKVAKTRTNRTVYGGDGISPDKQAVLEQFTAGRIALLDPIFFFTREIIYGRIPGISVSDSPDSPDEIKITPVFINFAKKWPGVSHLTKIDAEWAVSRIRFNLILAMSGNSAAESYRLRNDPVVKTALNFLPDALTFAKSTFTPKSPFSQVK